MPHYFLQLSGSPSDIIKNNKEEEDQTEDDDKNNRNRFNFKDYREMDMDIDTILKLRHNIDNSTGRRRLRAKVRRKYSHFPGDGDNKLHRVKLPKRKLFARYHKSPTDYNVYSLFTRKNPTSPQILAHNNSESIKKSNFKVKKVTVFIVHGWKGSSDNPMSKNLTKAFLYNADVNVIVLDWNHLAKRNYWSAREGTPYIGAFLGKFIQWLHKYFGLSLNRVHLVGFSLGAHLVGSAGRHLKGQVKRITALDPAGYLWSGLLKSGRLDKESARYVEVIHTNGGSMLTGHAGYHHPLGHSDHYPNGGSRQPGCGLLGVICSHSRAYLLMAETVKYNHLHAKKCNSLKHVNIDNCTIGKHPMGNANLNKKQ